MKVLFLTNLPSPYRVDFFNELGKICTLTVLYERKQATDRDEKWKAQKAEYFEEIFLTGKKFGNDSALCFSVYKYLKDPRYDLIVIGGYSTPTGILSIQYLKTKKKSFVLSCDGGMIKTEGNFIMKVKKHLISSASAWLSTGKKTTEYLLHYGAKKESIFKYPFTSLKNYELTNGNIKCDEKIRLKKELKIKEDKVILSVGQFIHRKGYDVLLKAMRGIDKSVGVYIVGGKPTEEYVALKVKFDLTNVHFLDFKSKEELKGYYQVADLFVLPTREDIWGLVINEAMANGLPVITTDKCLAGLELVTDCENGFIVPVETEEDLIEKINIVLSNKDLQKSMSKNSLDKIEDYTIEKMAERHMEIFKIVGGN